MSKLQEIAALLKSPPEEVISRISSLLSELKKSKKKLAAAKEKSVDQRVDELIASAEKLDGAMLVIGNLGNERMDTLLKACDKVKQLPNPAVTVLGATDNGKALLVCQVSKSLTDRVDASQIIREASAKVSGGGGGRKDFAQAGGSKPKGLDEALQYSRTAILRAFGG